MNKLEIIDHIAKSADISKAAAGRSLDAAVTAIKTAMKMLGRDTGELRLPMCPMEPALDAKLRTTLTGYGLL